MSRLLNEALVARMTAWKLTGQTSCARCKFMYLQDSGYSNYTIEETFVYCALNKNPNLGQQFPHDWDYEDGKDNWPATQNSRCERYEAADRYIHLDVDGETGPDDFGLDQEAVLAVKEHSGRYC